MLIKSSYNKKCNKYIYYHKIYTFAQHIYNLLQSIHRFGRSSDQAMTMHTRKQEPKYSANVTTSNKTGPGHVEYTNVKEHLMQENNIQTRTVVH